MSVGLVLHVTRSRDPWDTGLGGAGFGEDVAGLIGVERQVWMQVEGHDKVFAIADEDLERENDEKTSSVHFMRFQLTPNMIIDAVGGAKIIAGCDHQNMHINGLELNENVRNALANDLEKPTIN